MEFPSKLIELRELAKKATPGPWKYYGTIKGKDGYENRMCRYEDGDEGMWVPMENLASLEGADAAFIASANPARILNMIALVDKLIVDIEQLEYALNQNERIYHSEYLHAEWLAGQLANNEDPTLIPGLGCYMNCKPCEHKCRKDIWREAARKAVEESCQKK